MKELIIGSVVSLVVVMTILFFLLKEYQRQKRQEQKLESPKQNQKDWFKERYKHYPFFPISNLSDTVISWYMHQKLENPFLVTKHLIQNEMRGGFTHDELAMAVVSGLLERGWLPPNMTVEEVKEMKENIDKNKIGD